jgi:hypothetical protein
MDVPLDEVVYFDGIASSSSGAAVDADATPTFAVYEEATDTDIGVGGNMTKRTSLTGNYRGSFTASAANGFELGKWYSVIGSATVGGIVAKGVLKHFRIVAAETVAGYPLADTTKLAGQAVTAAAGVTFPSSVASPTNITAASGVSLTSGERGAIATQVEAQIMDEGDSRAVLQAIVDKINAADPNLSGLTLAAIAQAVRDVNNTAPAANSLGAALVALQADTDDIQTRLPAALTAGGNIKADALKLNGATPNNLAAGAAMTLAADSMNAAALATDAVAEIANGLLDLADGVETGFPLRKVLRGLAAAYLGKLSGAGTGTEVMRNLGDTKAVITATVDTLGNRTVVVLDLT